MALDFRKTAVSSTLIILFCLVFLTSFSVSAHAQDSKTFPWHSQAAIIDFAQPESGGRFAALTEEAHEKTILYLDWALKNISRSGLFSQFDKGADPQVADEEICAHVEQNASEPGGLAISGKPDPDNNHLLLNMNLDVARGGPFARTRCEYVESTNALRLRGFFYVTNIGTATAQNLEFQPVSIPPHLVPEAFMKHLR